jgi:3-hydroxybutyryl-CoA dehydrogenase
MVRLGRVGLIGGGTMGAGIAHVLLAAGVPVTLVESDAEALARARQRLAASLEAAAARGKLAAPPAALLGRLTGSCDAATVGGVDLVIEAVPESAELKRTVLAAVESAVEAAAAAAGREPVLATNTSSLSIDELAAGLRRPDRFVGMHFFNPVPASALVEVVRGAGSAPAAVRLAHEVAALLGKESIEVADSPGFATSRLGVLLGLEAIRMVQEGVAAPEDIDKAMVLGYRHPMGPLRLGDLVGLDVRLDVAEYLHGRFGDRFAPPRLLREMVADGRLGKKSGQGFYRWD